MSEMNGHGVTTLVQGGDCYCSPGRYIRFVDIPVPGIRGGVACRDRAAGKETRGYHPLPKKWVYLKHLPLLFLVFLLAACKPERSHLPPPMSEGKCVVNSWVATQQTDSVCTYDMYRYHCILLGGEYAATYQCVGMGPVPGEALPRK